MEGEVEVVKEELLDESDTLVISLSGGCALSPSVSLPSSLSSSFSSLRLLRRALRLLRVVSASKDR